MPTKFNNFTFKTVVMPQFLFSSLLKNLEKCHDLETWERLQKYELLLSIKYLIYHVTSQKHIIEGSCKFMCGRSSSYVTTLHSLVFMAIGMVEIYNGSRLSHVLARPPD